MVKTRKSDESRTRVKHKEEGVNADYDKPVNNTYLKSTISTSVHPLNTLMMPFVPLSLDPMIVSLLSLRRPSSGFTSSRKL